MKESFFNNFVVLLLSLLILSTGASFYTQPAKQSLREQDVEALLRYKGALYAAPGSLFGVSCSELVRRAYLETSVSEASKTVVRSKVCLSPEMRNGCSEQLNQVTTAVNLKELDYSKLKPGDVLVLGNVVAIHTIVYLGDGVFIHSDPVVESVVTFNRFESNVWFVYPVTVLRWKEFE